MSWNMPKYDTYTITLNHTLDLTKTLEFFKEHKVLSTSAVWGKADNIRMLVFRDGNIWMSVRSDDNKLKSTIEVVKFLGDLLEAQSLDVDASELISSSESYSDTVPENVILFSKLKEMRPNLRSTMDANIYRLLVHKGLKGIIGDRTGPFLKDIGRDLGAAAFQQSEPGSLAEAKKELKSFFEGYGLGMISFSGGQVEGEVMRVEMKESLTSSGLPPTGHSVCDLELGVIDGFFTRFYGKDVSVKEIDCVSKGDYLCVFTVSMYA